MSISHILVPIDGSDESKNALSLSIEMAKKFSAKISLLHVADWNAQMTSLDRVTMSGYIPGDILKEGYELLTAAARQIPKEIKTETAVVPGHPATVILEEAEKEKADLIVLGSRGLGAVKGLLLGSVSAAVIPKAPCPVLTTK